MPFIRVPRPGGIAGANDDAIINVSQIISIVPAGGILPGSDKGCIFYLLPNCSSDNVITSLTVGLIPNTISTNISTSLTIDEVAELLKTAWGP